MIGRVLFDKIVFMEKLISMPICCYFAIRMSEYRKLIVSGAFAVIVSAILWGFDGVVLTPRLYNLPVTLVVFILHAIPFLLMHIFFFKDYRWLKAIDKKNLIFLVLSAILGGAIGTLAIVKALFLVNFKSLTIVVLLQKLQPVFAISFAAIILKERLSKNFLLWASIAMVAGYFLTFGSSTPDFLNGDNMGVAALYSIFAAFCFGISTVFSRGVLLHMPFHAVTFFRYGITTLLMFFIVLFTGTISSIAAITSFNWLIIWIIVLTTGPGAIFLYLYGLKKIPASLATVFELFYPLSAILFDYIFNNRMLSTVQWTAAIVLVAAVIRLTYKPSTKN